MTSSVEKCRYGWSLHILPLSRILTWPWATGREHGQRSHVAPSGSSLQDSAAVVVAAAVAAAVAAVAAAAAAAAVVVVAAVVVAAAVTAVPTPANYDGWCAPWEG